MIANKGLRNENAERRRAEELRLVIDTIPVMAWTVRPDGLVDFLNRRWTDYSGLTLEQYVKDPTGPIHPQDIGRVLEKWSEQRVLGEAYDDEMRLRGADGEYRWFLVRTAPLRDEQGKLVKWYGVSTDIEDRKRAEEAIRRSGEELRQTQAELARATRLSMMGELTASIAHEVNQPLVGVVTNANAAARWLAAVPPNLEEVRRAIGRIARDGNRASEVIKRIRELMKKGAPAKAPVNLNELISETIALAQPELRRHQVALHADLAPQLPTVTADRVQVQQVLLNLVVNALDSLSRVVDRRRVLRLRTAPMKRKAVQVAVHDNGEGLAPEAVQRIFEPFYTTKPQGLGMGLAISRSIVEAHGGRLWATPHNRSGVTFQFTLPVRRSKGS